MTDNPQHYKLSAKALFQKVADETVILDTETGQYYTLDAIGTFLVEHLQAGKSLAETVDSGINTYAVSAQVLQDDLAELVVHMCSKGLLEATNSGNH